MQNERLLFEGGGEMGRRTRVFDWGSTVLGSIANWPLSLRNAVNIVLSSRFPMFIWWGPDLIQFYNDAYRPSLGNTGKHPAALGQRGEECWPEIWPVIYPLIRQVMDTGESTWSEDQLIPIYRNGRLEDVYWTFSYSPIIGDDGDIGGVLVVCNENTDKVINYQKLRESEDNLSFAIEAAELGTWDYNPHTGKFGGNNRLKSWFGLGAGEEIDLTLAIEAMIPADRGRVAAAIQRALQYDSGGLYDIKYTVRSKIDGTERIVRAKGRAWFGEDKQAYRFNGTLQDITDQETAHLGLEHAQGKAELAIESGQLGTYELDMGTDIMITSDRFNAIWGVVPPVSHHKLVELVHPDDRDVRLRAHARARRTGYLDYETRILRQDDAERWVRVKGIISYDPSGQPLTLTGVIQDITIEKIAEEELTRQVALRTLELQRSNEDLLQFAHVISHDLKEPVRKIGVFSLRLLDELPEVLSPTALNYLSKIRHANDRMRSMIEGVLNYAAASSTSGDLVAIDLNEMLQQVENDLELVIEQKEARIEAGGLPTVYGIRVLIYQLFYNLVNNALKFSRPGTPPVIWVTAAPAQGRSPNYVQIAITDNGIGFRKEQAEAIFNSFTRLHSKDIFEGTGLGLALAKKIVERHGGTIYATGEPGEGASFMFSLLAGPLV